MKNKIVDFLELKKIRKKNKNKNIIQGKSLSLGNYFVHEYGSFEEHNNRLNFTSKGLLSLYKNLLTK